MSAVTTSHGLVIAYISPNELLWIQYIYDQYKRVTCADKSESSTSSSLQLGSTDKFCPLRCFWTWGYWHILGSKIIIYIYIYIYILYIYNYYYYYYSPKELQHFSLDILLIYEVLEKFESKIFKDFLTISSLYVLNCFKYFKYILGNLSQKIWQEKECDLFQVFRYDFLWQND